MVNAASNLPEPAGAPDHLDGQKILAGLKSHPRRPLFPPAADRKAWNGIPREMRAQRIAAAEKSLKKPWPVLTAAGYMKFRRAGDRKAYETPYWERRYKLVDLVLGECCEHKGRFMDEIVEGLWQIVGEPVWCVPAHEALPEGELFPDPSRFKVDIFSVSTGRLLCDTLSLLGPELTGISPFLVRRVETEVMRRLVEPAEKLDDATAWWFCGRNNWTVWCASDLTGCAIHLLDDQPERLAKFIGVYLGIARRFYNRYPDDGGCNEGPSYWRHAPGKYIQLLNQLDNRLGLKGKIFEDAKLRRMCEYLPGMNLSGHWFLSTNDAAPRVSSDSRFVAFVAEKIKSPSMTALAQRLKDARSPYVKVTELDGPLCALFAKLPDKQLPAALPAVNHWPDLGISILRENPDSPEKGTVVSLKGGHNGESHNHLDLGHFTLMRKNKPLIVDVGSGVYTAVTFSQDRYTLWNTNATGHNSPRFSGRGQEAGLEYKAPVTVEGDSVTAALLDKAYPAAAGVEKLTRKLVLDRRTGNVELCDTAVVDGSRKVEITLYTAVEPEKVSDSCVKWPGGKLTLTGLKVAAVAEESRMDEVMTGNWGRLWRIELTGRIAGTGSWKMFFDFGKEQ